MLMIFKYKCGWWSWEAYNALVGREEGGGGRRKCTNPYFLLLCKLILSNHASCVPLTAKNIL